jgi:hypothetical protein
MAKAINRKVPSMAAMRGSMPAAFRIGGSRVSVVAATRLTNNALDARVAILNKV